MLCYRALKVIAALSAVVAIAATALRAEELEFDGWRPYSPREEIRPGFEIEKSGGPDGSGGLVIAHDERDGLDGAWARMFEVDGDCHYRVTAYSRGVGLSNPRHHSYVELEFHDDRGNLVLNRQTGLMSRPFYAAVVDSDREGWTKFSGIFRAPAAATRATVRLHLRWEPGGKIEWGRVSLAKSEARTTRKVRLATCNYRPSGGKSGIDNCRQLDPWVAKAAEEGADLLVLGECITSVGTKMSVTEAAEPIPGPATDYLAILARRHRLFLVTTIYERADHLVYNTAVLLSPRGELVGTYRKVCPARGEYRKGIAPGGEFPVFNTSIGRIGMMICFDVHMPEVARGLAANGAEIIALPIMGGHPDLARARAIENQVYLVTSTYSVNDDWMQTGVWSLSGDLLARAVEENSMVIAEVDLAEQYFWRANMGEFKGRLRHERPAVPLPD